MKISLELDSKDRQDLYMMACLGRVSETYLLYTREGGEEDPDGSNNDDETAHNPKEEEVTDEKPKPSPSEVPQPDKPKRTRKKKDSKTETKKEGMEETEQPPLESPVPSESHKFEVEAPLEECDESGVAENASNAEEPQPANDGAGKTDKVATQPLVAEVEMPLEPEGKITREEWSLLLVQKRVELNITNADGTLGLYGDQKDNFHTFAKEHAVPYGADMPGKLEDGARYRYYHEVFKLIQYEPTRGFYLGEPMPTDEPPY